LDDLVPLEPPHPVGDAADTRAGEDTTFVRRELLVGVVRQPDGLRDVRLNLAHHNVRDDELQTFLRDELNQRFEGRAVVLEPEADEYLGVEEDVLGDPIRHPASLSRRITASPPV